MLQTTLAPEARAVVAIALANAAINVYFPGDRVTGLTSAWDVALQHIDTDYVSDHVAAALAELRGIYEAGQDGSALADPLADLATVHRAACHTQTVIDSILEGANNAPRCLGGKQVTNQRVTGSRRLLPAATSLSSYSRKREPKAGGGWAGRVGIWRGSDESPGDCDPQGLRFRPKEITKHPRNPCPAEARNTRDCSRPACTR